MFTFALVPGWWNKIEESTCIYLATIQLLCTSHLYLLLPLPTGMGGDNDSFTFQSPGMGASQNVP